MRAREKHILEIVSLLYSPSVSDIKANCDYSKEEIRKSLEFLTDKGFLDESPDNRYKVNVEYENRIRFEGR